MAAAGSRHRPGRRNVRTGAATLAHAALLLFVAAAVRPARAGNIQDQVKDWLDWITGKDAQPSGGGDPAELPGSSSTLNCSPRAGTTTCILTCALGSMPSVPRAAVRFDVPELRAVRIMCWLFAWFALAHSHVILPSLCGCPAV